VPLANSPAAARSSALPQAEQWLSLAMHFRLQLLQITPHPSTVVMVNAQNQVSAPFCALFEMDAESAEAGQPRSQLGIGCIFQVGLQLSCQSMQPLFSDAQRLALSAGQALIVVDCELLHAGRSFVR
jgi:hypothetical protein